MDDVAAEAGVAKGLLYQHFASKEELFHALMQQKGDEFASRLEATLSEALEEFRGEPSQLVRVAMREWLRQLTTEVNEQQWLANRAFEEACAPFRQRVRATVAESLRSVDARFPPEIASLLAAALEGASETTARVWASAASKMTDDDLVDLLVSFCMGGIRSVWRDLGVDPPSVPEVRGPATRSSTDDTEVTMRKHRRNQRPASSA